MLPSDLEVLIHCHCGVGPHPRLKAPAVLDAITRFLEDEILKPDGDDVYTTTKRGKAWLEGILRVPYPEYAIPKYGVLLKTSSKLIITSIGFGISSYVHYLVGSILLDSGSKWKHVANMLTSYPFIGMTLSVGLLFAALVAMEEKC